MLFGNEGVVRQGVPIDIFKSTNEVMHFEMLVISCFPVYALWRSPSLGQSPWQTLVVCMGFILFMFGAGCISY